MNKLFAKGILCGAGALAVSGLLIAQARLPEGSAQVVGVTGYVSNGAHRAVAWRLSSDGRRLLPSATGAIGLGAVAVSANSDAVEQMGAGEATPSDAEIAAEASRQQDALGGGEGYLHTEATRMSICAGSPIPDGWLKVDDYWSPTVCGNPTSITYNVWVIERYDNRPVGAVMDVCASAPTPRGWVVRGTAWNPNRCGHPVNITQNIKRIQRVN